MPQVQVYIRKGDYQLWLATENKAALVAWALRKQAEVKAAKTTPEPVNIPTTNFSA